MIAPRPRSWRLNESRHHAEEQGARRATPQGALRDTCLHEDTAIFMREEGGRLKEWPKEAKTMLEYAVWILSDAFTCLQKAIL